MKLCAQVSKGFVGVLVLAVFVLSGCTEPAVKPQVQEPVQEPPAPAQNAPAVKTHHLSRVAETEAVTPELLDSIQVGETSREQVVELLGEIKPFSLGDGKSILRYDVGKFIFDQNNMLIRKFVNP